MSDFPANTKSRLREQIRARLKALSVEDRAALATRLVGNLLAHRIWTKARSALLFSPITDEPDIRPLIGEALGAGKLTALPFFDASAQCYSARFIRDAAADLVAGEFGILEPRSSCAPAPLLNRLDLVLVPGVAFDAQGWRLGRGKGYYDRLLTQVRGTTCGVAFDEQMVEAIPHEPHDVRLNCILTPTRLIET